MTEAAHQMTSNALPPGARKPGSVGIAAGPEVAIVDEVGNFLETQAIGQVIVRGQNIMSGYEKPENNSDAFGHGNWFRTGDQGYLDSDGYLFLTGRLKEMINRGGESIAPREIDEALMSHPSVSQALAFSIPDENVGEEIGAAVVLEPEASTSESEIFDYLEPLLSFAKVPKRIVILDQIPKGPTGKLQRIGLAEKLGITEIYHEKTSESTLFDSSNTEIELKIAELWRLILKRDIGLNELFLDAGGDSISATILVYRIEEEFKIDVPLVRFFKSPTIRDQSRLIGQILDG